MRRAALLRPFHDLGHAPTFLTFVSWHGCWRGGLTALECVGAQEGEIVLSDSKRRPARLEAWCLGGVRGKRCRSLRTVLRASVTD